MVIWLLFYSQGELHSFVLIEVVLMYNINACNVGDPGSIPGLGRSPGEGNGNPLQYSCLEIHITIYFINICVDIDIYRWH